MACPFCSIIIPAYNAEQTIGQCLESLQLKDHFETSVEVLVIDDGSNDQTALVAQRSLNGVQNAKVISQANGGVSKARNAGLLIAKGKYICFLDADDTIDREALEKVFEIALARECDFLLADYIAIEKDSIQTKECNFPHNQMASRPELQKVFLSNIFTYNGQGLPTVWGKLFKRELIEKNQLLFDERQKYGEDLAFSLTYANYAETVLALGHPFYRYFISGAIPYRKRDYSYDLKKVHELLLSMNDEYGVFSKDSSQYFSFKKHFFYETLWYLKNEFVSSHQKREFLRTHVIRDTLRYLKQNKKALTQDERKILFFLTPLLYRISLRWV